MTHPTGWLVTSLSCLALLACSADGPTVGTTRQAAWTPLAVDQDPLVRMPGTQPGGAGTLEPSTNCTNNCHAGYNKAVEPGHNWRGSMMAQAARDFLFWSCFTVAGQDSIWAIGRPNAMDLCERCHFPKGWVEGRSDPPNASLMTGSDYDGVQCDSCHKMYDPFYESTFNGTREGSDWAGYWDEATQASQTAAAATRQDDIAEASKLTLFNSNPAYQGNLPASATYSEAGSGQYYIAGSAQKRASFQDAGAKHSFLYSRFHKSRYFCSSCHDVSNPALANLALKDLAPGDKTTVLPSEKDPASSYFHVERTFSEFMLSAYGQQGGADGIGPFAPSSLATSRPGNKIASCQDCHMRDVAGVACNKNSSVNRPSGSTEHPKSGVPLHDMTGGNIWVSHILASAVGGSTVYDAQNASLLGQGAAALTLDLTQGEGVDPVALLDGVARAKQQLQMAAAIQNLTYNSSTGALAFRVQNQTGHKLISGFPEGRRMFINIKAYKGGALVREINPYDASAGTLKGLPASFSSSSPPLGAAEQHDDALVYEMHPSSTLTGEAKTFHFVLADGRYKDNRIPPKGFDISKAAARKSEPVWQGAAAPALYTAQEYAGGYDQVAVTLPAGADQVYVRLFYQVTSREYVEFLRDEIKGTNPTLPAAAYIIQTDAFFAKLKAWGDTIWQLWDHNKNVPGAAPFLMAEASVGGGPPPCDPPVPALVSVTPASGQAVVTWSDEHTADASVVGYKVYYDQSGKAQLVTQVGQVTSYTDSGLNDGQTYCYKVAALYVGCESAASNIKCATPSKSAGTPCTAASQCGSGFCVDGMCCDSACGGGSAADCQACSLAAGAAQNGVCGPVSSGTTCRAAAGACDQAETCNGISTSCPLNSFKSASTVCRLSGGLCDLVEYCSGSAAACPGDLLASAGTVCRASTDPCDPAESCDGSAKACPSDVHAPDGTPCASGTGQCSAGTCVVATDSGVPTPDQAVPASDQAVPVPDQAVPTPDQVVPTPDQGPASDQGPAPDQSVTSDQSPTVDQTVAADQSTAVDQSAPPSDSVAPVVDAGAADMASTPDLGQPPPPTDDGCSCQTGSGATGGGALPMLVLLALAALGRRRRSR